MPNPLPPGSTIGILGGGQLGRMLAMAAARLGYHTHIYCPEADCPAFEVAREHTIAAYTDAEALKKFARAVDVITLEFENVPTEALNALSSNSLRPSVSVLSICQDRIEEKTAIRNLGIGTADFAAVTSESQLRDAVKRIGLPAILKTTRMGYDGKGQYKIRQTSDIDELASTLFCYAERSEGSSLSSGNDSSPAAQNDRVYILESFVDFELEISVIAARSPSGELRCFPPVHNIHRDHILHQTHVPAPISNATVKDGLRIAAMLAEGLKVEGLLAVEMFVKNDGSILVNELAPRPHNSGHWSMDACATDQFEQAIRAVCDLPLGSTDVLYPATMTNLIGDEINDWQRYLLQSNTRLHLYGKKEARPGRKMGHVTVFKKD